MTQSSRIRELASDLIANAPQDEHFDAREILNQHPELQDHHSVVLNLAFEEYCRRIDDGDDVKSSEFANQFSDVRRSLMRMIEVEKYFRRDSQINLKLQSGLYPEVGSEFLGFHLRELLGRGALSRVFIANENEIGGRTVVAKVCRRGTAEADKLGRLEHPGVVPVHSICSCDETQLSLICMPLLTRATLFHAIEGVFRDAQFRPKFGKQLIDVVRETNASDSTIAPEIPSNRERSFAMLGFDDAVLDIGIQIAEALDFSHRLGIFHCDIKPTNVLLTVEGKALLLDFNLSVNADANESVLGGTMPYMPPEQLRTIISPAEAKQFVACAAVDLFSLGATLFELLTGELPFGEFRLDGDREDVAELMYQTQQARCPALQAQLESVTHPSLARIIARCLQFNPMDRPASAGELVRQLQALLDPRQKLLRWGRENRRDLLMGLVGSMLCFGVFVQSPAGDRLMRQMGILPETVEFQFEKQLAAARSAAVAGKFSLADQHYQKARGLLPFEAVVQFEYACNLVQIDRINDAFEQFQQLQATTSSHAATAWIGYCHLREQTYASAVDVLRPIVSRGQRDTATLTNFGNALAKQLPSDETLVQNGSAILGRLQAIPEQQRVWQTDFAIAFLHHTLLLHVDNQVRSGQPAESTGADDFSSPSADRQTLANGLIKAAETLLNRSEVHPFACWRAAIFLIQFENGAPPQGRTLELIQGLLRSAVEQDFDPQRIREVLQAYSFLDADGAMASRLAVSDEEQHVGIPELAVKPEFRGF